MLPAHVPPRHECPQLPQWAALVASVTHWLLHTVWPAAHGVHTLFEQMALATQSELAPQLVAQAVVPLHVNGVHIAVTTAGQAPAPLQPAARVSVPLAQLDARQLVPLPG